PGPVQDAIMGTFREVLPMSTCVAQIPGWDLTYTRSLGYDLEDLYEEGARMQEARRRAIGLPLDDIPNFPLPLDMPPRERGERGIKLMKAQYLGPKEGTFTPDDEATEILFDQIGRQVVPGSVGPGTVIQWDFTDAEPWHLVVDDGNTRVARGRAPSPDLVLRSSFEDWVDVTSGRADPAKLVLRRRLRPSGRLRLMARLPRIFA
ncbi:MAG TPA: SCP2 sterol-binding domain-containing protein, partial [Solirubrobacteraceae bacterium]|nr:SCP2 sterol-binding domain-containing protein [Solirubrobacteraceae bacterium]